MYLICPRTNRMWFEKPKTEEKWIPWLSCVNKKSYLSEPLCLKALTAECAARTSGSLLVWVEGLDRKYFGRGKLDFVLSLGVPPLPRGSQQLFIMNLSRGIPNLRCFINRKPRQLVSGSRYQSFPLLSLKRDFFALTQVLLLFTAAVVPSACARLSLSLSAPELKNTHANFGSAVSRSHRCLGMNPGLQTCNSSFYFRVSHERRQTSLQ